METNFKQVLEEKKALVWPEIESYLNTITDFPEYCLVPSVYHYLIRFYRQIVGDYPERKGKYLRPSLVLLTASAMGFPEKKALKTASAMQISEDWILNHDDIEDNSLERRGMPALHRIYGAEQALNAGDGLHVLMWKVLQDNRKVVGDKKAFEIMDEFYKMLNRTVFGQMTEIKWTKENRTDLKDKDILFILESKTGYYTIAGPMRLGAILAGANDRQLADLYEFGKYLGYCFQIKDDLLDLTSDFSGLKKQTGNDIYEGKRTIMLLHLFRILTGNDLRKLEVVMEKNREEKTAEEVQWVIRKMEEAGSLRYGQKLAEEFAQKAREVFKDKLGFLSRQPAADQIQAGVDFILKRDH